MLRLWQKLSISRKLYTVVGLMAFLVAGELIALVFVVNTLSAVRALVEGEGNWTKAQKDAVQSLYRYAIHRDRKYYVEFQDALKIPNNYHVARLELMKSDGDEQKIRTGLESAGTNPRDVQSAVNLIRGFRDNEYLFTSLNAWAAADEILLQLEDAGAELDAAIQSKANGERRVNRVLEKVSRINERFTETEMIFSGALSEGSRWIEGRLLLILALLVITVEGTGLSLTYLLGRSLQRGLSDLNNTAKEIGEGNYSAQASVDSKDELGQLASSLNQMADNLRDSEKLKLAKEAAENASAIKSSFLANMSHEIRTPLGIILGFSDLVLTESLSDEDRDKAAEAIRRNGELLSNIINDILDISKVEAGALELERKDVDFSEVIKDLQSLLSLRAVEKGIQLNVIAAASVPNRIHTDPLRLRQILLNVVGNAIKFTNRGYVTVDISLQETANIPKLSFKVTDTGRGISAAEGEKLFTPFAQADPSMTRKYGGTGLGLALSKKLAKALGGDIVLVRSQPAQGSQFEITIDPGVPATVAKPVAADTDEVLPTTPFDFSGSRVLLVDDSLDNQMMIRHYLLSSNVVLVSAENGKEGVEKALSGNFDLVLMDIQMPVMNGHEAIAELQRHNYKVPVIALTAHALKEERERCLAEGFVAHLSKPIPRSTLLVTLAKHLSRKAAAS